MSAVASESIALADQVVVTYHGDTAVAAGSLIVFEVRIEARHALPTGTEIGLARRWPSDWGTPQFTDPSRADYVRIAASGGRQLRWWYARQHAWHPFDHVLFIALPDGLAAGEPLRVQFGGTREHGACAPGFVAQTFIEEASPLSVRMRASDANHTPWIELARPTVRIVGSDPHRLVLTAPSRVQTGKPFKAHLRIEDRWGNPSQLDATVRVDTSPEAVIAVPDEGWMHFEAVLTGAGIHRLTARASTTIGADFTATSNPIEAVDGPLATELCWGDLHAQSVIGCGARSIDAYFKHARDFAATDFGSHQANCFLVSNPEWKDTERSTAEIHEDRRFVTLLGVEWSAASACGGDHNLYFPGDSAALHRCSHEFVDDKSDVSTDLKHVDDLYAHYRGSDTLVAVHVGGRTADLRWHEPQLERLIEVHSTHATSEWFLLDALKRGYRMGVIAGSDSVDGRPGASHPGHMAVRNVRGGLTAVEMPELTRSALWSALKSRRCYGTTGARILLRLTAGTGHINAHMGDEIRVSKLPSFEVMVEGTAPLESVDFFRDDVMLESIDVIDRCAVAGELSNAIRIGWCGTTAPGNWQRARMLWEGELSVHGARIIDATPWALDSPDEGIIERDDHRLRFRSITAGDWDGFIVTLDDSSVAELTFVTQPMMLHARLSDLKSSPRVFAADNPARKVELRRLPRAMPPTGWRGAFDDPSPPPGAHAYWIRVRQSDGEFAWSTPIFTTVEPAS